MSNKLIVGHSEGIINKLEQAPWPQYIRGVHEGREAERSNIVLKLADDGFCVGNQVEVNCIDDCVLCWEKYLKGDK